MDQRLSHSDWEGWGGGKNHSMKSFLDLVCSGHYKVTVQFSSSVMSDSLWPHEPQHARPPCPSPTPRVHSNSCPLSQWCHSAISSSVIPFSSCPQSFPASGSLPLSQLFTMGSQSIGASAWASVLPVNIRGWFSLWLTVLISLLKIQGTIKIMSSLLQNSDLNWRN